MQKSVDAFCGVEGKTEDWYLARFKCYAIYDVCVGCIYVAVAVKDPIALLIALLFFLDVGCLLWLSSAMAKMAPFLRLRGITSINAMTNTGTLAVFLVIRTAEFLTKSHGGTLTKFFWDVGPVSVLLFVFVGGSKLVKILVVHSFRAWLALNHPDAQARGLIARPPIVQMPALTRPCMAAEMTTQMSIQLASPRHVKSPADLAAMQIV